MGTHSQSSWPDNNSFADTVWGPSKTFRDDNLQSNFLTWNSTSDISIHDSIHRKRQWKALGYIYDRHPICRSYTGFFSLFVGTHSQSSWPVDNSFADAVCGPPKTFRDDNLQSNYLLTPSTKGTFLSKSTYFFVITPNRRTFFSPETENLNFCDL